MFYKKNNGDFKSLKNTVLLGAVLTPILFMSLNGIFSQVDVKADGVAHVKSLKQLRKAFKSENKEIKLEEDIDLSNWDGTPLNAGDAVTKFDGQGHRFYDKNFDYFYNPLFNASLIKIYNVVFDNTAFILNSWSQVAQYITPLNGLPTLSELQENEAVYDFENISFVNIDATLDFSSGPKGLLFNEYELNESGFTYQDNALVLKNISVLNSDIDIVYDNISVDTSLGLIGNIRYDVCSTLSHRHQGFVWIKDIIVSNNNINLSYKRTSDSEKELSISPVLGKFSGLSDWQGSYGNYLWIDNVLLQQNQFASQSTNLKLNYGEIISQPLSASSNNQKTKIEKMQNIISINNQVFINKDDQLEVEDSRVIALQNDGDNEVVFSGTDSMFFVGDLYDKDKQLNIFENTSPSQDLHSITHDKKLNSSNQDFRKLNNLLLNNFGIYNTFLKVDKDDNLDRVEFSNKNDRVFIAPESELSGNDSLLSSFNLRFSFLKGFGTIFDENDIINTAFKMKNIKIKDGSGDVLFKMRKRDHSVETSADSSFLYEVKLVNDGRVNINDIDVNDLYMTFDYDDSTRSEKASTTTTVKLNPDELGNINIDAINGSGAEVPVAIAVGSTTGIILLILLLLLLLFLYRRYKLSKVVEMDDGYLEFVNQDDRNEDYEGQYAQNFDNGQEYGYEDENYAYDDESYEQVDDYEEYAEEAYEEYDYDQNADESYAYDEEIYGQDDSYEENNAEIENTDENINFDEEIDYDTEDNNTEEYL